MLTIPRFKRTGVFLAEYFLSTLASVTTYVSMISTYCNRFISRDPPKPNAKMLEITDISNCKENLCVENSRPYLLYNNRNKEKMPSNRAAFAKGMYNILKIEIRV
jgi:hypothetical protein